MPKYLTISEARQQMLGLPDELVDEPVMVALSYEHFASLVETLDILSDSTFANRLKESITQADQGKTISWEEAISTVRSVNDPKVPVEYSWQ